MVSDALEFPEEATVFAHHCSACQKRQLIFPSQIIELDNTEAGIVVHFTCWCSAPQALVTGRRSTRPDVPAAA